MSNSFSKWEVLDATYMDGSGRERKIFDPHSEQLKLAEDNARFLVACCGRRLGKSRWVGHEFLPEAKRAYLMKDWLKDEGKRLEYWSVGPEYSDSEKPFRVFYDKCVALQMPFDKPGTYFSQESGSMTVSLWDGAFIYSAKSAKHPERLVGEGLAGVHLEEAAKLKQIVWTQMIQPTLGDFKGWAKFTSTPEGKNWFYDLFNEARKPAKQNWSAYRIPSWKNPWVYETPTLDDHVKILVRALAANPGLTSWEIAKSLNLTIDEAVLQCADDNTIPTFQQEYAAEFTDFVGKVFKDFDEETHCRPLTFNPNWETIAAVDYGYTNPNVWLLIQIGPRGEINVIDELYQSDLSPVEFANEILRRGLVPDICTEFYPDPASPGDTKTLETIFRQAGKRVKSRPHTGGEINDRLNLIRLALKDKITDNEANANQWVTGYPKNQRPRDLMRPRIMFNSSKCIHTIDEMAEYRYPERKDDPDLETSRDRFELPLKRKDHCPEALGRFLMGKYKSEATQMGGGARITKANFIRGIRGRGYAYADHEHGVEPAGILAARNPQMHGNWAGKR